MSASRFKNKEHLLTRLDFPFFYQTRSLPSCEALRNMRYPKRLAIHAEWQSADGMAAPDNVVGNLRQQIQGLVNLA